MKPLALFLYMPQELEPKDNAIPADIEQFIEKWMTPVVQQLHEAIQANKVELEASLKSKAIEPKAESAFEQRVKTLEKQLEEAAKKEQAQEKAAAGLRFDNALSSQLDTMNPIHKSIVQELLSNRLKQDIVEKDGQWLTKDGKTLTEVTTEFFGSEQGLHFLPSQHRDGAGTKEPTKANTGASEPDLGTQLARSFGY